MKTAIEVNKASDKELLRLFALLVCEMVFEKLKTYKKYRNWKKKTVNGKAADKVAKAILKRMKNKTA